MERGRQTCRKRSRPRTDRWTGRGWLRGAVGRRGMELQVGGWTGPVSPLARVTRWLHEQGRLGASLQQESLVRSLRLGDAAPCGDVTAAWSSRSPAWRRLSCPTCWPLPDMQDSPGHTRGVRMPALRAASKCGQKPRPPNAGWTLRPAGSVAASPQLVRGALQGQKALTRVNAAAIWKESSLQSPEMTSLSH